MIPEPSDGLVIKLATIAVQADELLAPDHPSEKAPVGVRRMKDDRRRTMEAILVLLADAEVRNYLAELQRLGLVAVIAPV